MGKTTTFDECFVIKLGPLFDQKVSDFLGKNKNPIRLK